MGGTSASDPGSRHRAAAIQLLLRAITEPWSPRSLQGPEARTTSNPSMKDLFFLCFCGALCNGRRQQKPTTSARGDPAPVTLQAMAATRCCPAD